MALTKVDTSMVGYPAFGRRMNRNGDCTIDQRGGLTTSQNGKGGCDGFNLASSAFGVYSMYKDNDVAVNGFRQAHRINCTTANTSPASSAYAILQLAKFEGNNCIGLKFGTSEAEDVSVQFWIYSNKTGTYNLELYNAKHSGSDFNVQQFTINSANTWEHKTLTFSGDTGGNQFDDSSDNQFNVNLWLAAGSSFTSGSHVADTWANVAANRAVNQANFADSTSNNLRITGLQVEAGNPTPFEYRSRQVELAHCERYLEVLKSSDDDYNAIWGSSLNSDGNVWQSWHFRQEKRAKPTFFLGNSAAWSQGGTNQNVYEGVSSINFNSNSWFYFSGNSEGTAGLFADSDF